MLKVIIVDDEYLFRQTLVQTFDWQNYDLSVCGEAANGQDALNLLSEQLPDIALVDINMPTMNGLEFVKAAKQCSPNTHFIIISGYDNFSYAQQAISLGVEKYLLKPLQFEELAETLEKVVAQVSLKRSEQSFLSYINERYDHYRVVLREQLLNKLIFPEKSFHIQKIEKECRYLELSWPQCEIHYIVVAMPIDADTQRSMYASMDMLKNILATIYSGIPLPFDGQPCITRDNTIAIMFSFNKQIKQETLFLELKRIHALLYNALQQHFRLSLSQPVKALSQIPQAYTQAYELLRNAPSHTGYIISNERKETVSAQHGILTQQQCVQLIAYFRMRDSLQVKQFMAVLTELLNTHTYTSTQLFALFLDITPCYLKISEENQLTAIYDSVLAEIRRGNTGFTKKDLLDNLNQWNQSIFIALRKKDSYSKSPIVEDAIAYIDTHYSDPNLSIEMISKALFLNYTYLCSSFKKDMNITINKYIKQRRIQKSLQLMDAGINSISEVAAAVGFSSANYFCKCFKKEMDILPSEYLLLSPTASEHPNNHTEENEL